jgi:hypothetical protein
VAMDNRKQKETEKKMLDNEFVGIVVNKEQKKFLYRKIDGSIFLAFVSGFFLSIGGIISEVYNERFYGFLFICFSFIIFFFARYVGLRILFENSEGDEDE